MKTVPEDFPIKTEVVDAGERHGIPWVSARTTMARAPRLTSSAESRLKTAMPA